MKEVKQKLKHDPVPQLVESYVESDDKSQAEQAGYDADFDPGGNDVAEKQMWRNQINFDRPDQHSNDFPEQPVQPQNCLML